MSKTHHLDLLNNSISYFREAVSYAQRDTDDTDHWKFAILHVVQAMELAFKERLRRIHPAFIYESVDGPGKTLSLRGALERLKNPQIGNIPIAEAEAAKIVKAFDLRSELTHFEFNHSHDHIELKFAEIFSFMIFFYRGHLGLATADFIDEDEHNKVIRLVRTRAELLERAKAYISGRDDDNVWLCPSCQEATYDPLACMHDFDKAIDRTLTAPVKPFCFDREYHAACRGWRRSPARTPWPLAR